MSQSANVRSIQALSDLRGALGRFSGEAQTSLNAAQLEIRRTLEWLAERQRHWQRQVRRWQEEVSRAQSALARCQNSGYYDHRTGRSHAPDCRPYEQALRQAQRYLGQAESELRTVQQAIKAVQQAAADYQRQAQRLATIVGSDVPKAAALLGRSIATLQSYVAMSAPSSGGASLGASSSPTDTPTNAKWVEQGIIDVPIEQIDTSESSVQGAQDFRKVSHDQMVAGLQKLEEVVRPAVQNGVDGDYFSELDAEQGLEYANGYRCIYDAFYGSEPIRLEKVGESYQVTNGQHRLFVARQLGLKNIPASVISQELELD
ncbi:MAG: hypothetical protein ACPGWR_03365 [Ardenticatenaceae bacterium]